MPTFDSRGPIAVNLEIGVGDVHIVAGDRTDTVVEVRPADPSRNGDVTYAAQTSVDLSDGGLRIKTPRSRRHYSFRNGCDSVRVTIELPAGSVIGGHTGMGTFTSTGRLGDCRYKSGAGDVTIESAGSLSLKTGAGNISVAHVRGDCNAATASGAVRLGRIDGSVAVKTASGDIHFGEVRRGTVSARTAYGRIEVGVRAGVAAWLDLSTGFGKVHSDLDGTDGPGAGEETVEIKAHTAFGDIAVLRAVEIS